MVKKVLQTEIKEGLNEPCQSPGGAVNRASKIPSLSSMEVAFAAGAPVTHQLTKIAARVINLCIARC